MSIDRYYTLVDEKWFRVDKEVHFSDFWVDICHGGDLLVDERYYFQDLASALDFYLHGWRVREYLDDTGQPRGLDHGGLYSRGRLMHGHSILGDAPGHEGQNLRHLCGELARKLNDEEMQL